MVIMFYCINIDIDIKQKKYLRYNSTFLMFEDGHRYEKPDQVSIHMVSSSWRCPPLLLRRREWTLLSTECQYDPLGQVSAFLVHLIILCPSP